ncbi:MAG: DegV family protein [Oscillospiraceae bacterium]|nr:DegV family protein [Oscillospiraceae bacterium]
MGIRVIVDSTADLTPQVRERVVVVPLTVHFGEEEFVDGIDLTGAEFYEKLAVSPVLPTTSQASPYAFSAAFGQAVADGEEVIAITVSSRLSGTYQSAVIAAEDYPGSVHVVDSRNIALGSAILTEYALGLVDEGRGAEEIVSLLEAARERIRLMAVVDTLEFLQRGGRLSKTAAIAGGLLSIKPVIALVDGEIKVIAKGRGNKQANALMNQQVRGAGIDTAMPMMLGYTGTCSKLLECYCSECGDLWPEGTPRSVVCGVVGTHAGPGAVALAFFAK